MKSPAELTAGDPSFCGVFSSTTAAAQPGAPSIIGAA